jgi:hypothetical protein
MAVIYSQTAIDDRLQGVITAIGAGFFKLLAGATTVSTINLSSPCGTVSGGILTFTGGLSDPSAAASGTVTTAVIESSDGAVQVSGLTVGTPLSGADILINNGLNTTFITAGQVVSFVNGQITGS